jgi:transposase
MDSHTHSSQTGRLEVVETGRRRRWSEDEKLKIVLESLQAPRRVSATARRYGISRTLLLQWRRSFRVEQKGVAEQEIGFVPAMVAPEEEPSAPLIAPAPLKQLVNIDVNLEPVAYVPPGAAHDVDGLADLLPVLSLKQNSVMDQHGLTGQDYYPKRLKYMTIDNGKGPQNRWTDQGHAEQGDRRRSRRPQGDQRPDWAYRPDCARLRGELLLRAIRKLQSGGQHSRHWARRAVGEHDAGRDRKLAEQYLGKAANFAKDLAPYEAPRLSSVRVGGNTEGPLTINVLKFSEADCVTIEEYRAEQARLINGLGRTNGSEPEHEGD